MSSQVKESEGIEKISPRIRFCRTFLLIIVTEKKRFDSPSPSVSKLFPLLPGVDNT